MLVISVYGILHLSPVQTWLVKKIASNLSEQLDTRVTIKTVDFRFFDKLLLKDLMVEDRKKDTVLFAGIASVNITDWFFLRDTITLNNIGLEDAIVNMNRTDSVWNYQFLVDFFSSPSTGKKSGNGVQVDIREIHLKNIKFNKTDKWVGQDMVVYLQKLDVSMEKMDIANKQIFIKDIYLEKPLFAQTEYDGSKPSTTNLTTIMEQIPVVSAFKWNQSGWQVKVNKLQVFDGSFVNNQYTERKPYTDMFDGQHIRFFSINGNISNMIFLADTLHANISLTAKEQGGLEIKKLQSHLKFSPELMEFKELDLQTNKSKLGNYFSMQYNSFNKDMSSFIHNVTMNADLNESVLSSDDLAIFAPALSDMKRIFFLQGKAKGTVDNFSAKSMIIKTGSTLFNGEVAMRGLPDINSTFIDLNAKLLQTNYTELVTIIPALQKVKTPSLNKLGAIKYTGKFTGFVNDFVAYGKINTSLGNLIADLNMKLPAKGQPSYSGKLITQGFNLGQFINDKNLGIIMLNGAIVGKNFTLDKLDANFKGQLHRLDYGGYSYQNISIDGDFENKKFKGHASIDDPNIKISNLDGEFNLSEKLLSFNADANLEYINFKNIGLTKDQITLSGIFSLNFTGNNIDDFLGTASIYDANLQHDSTRLSFDSLVLKSYFLNDQKSLSIQSNELDASIYGQFKIMELPDAFKVFLGRYYPSYIELPKYWVKNQEFKFNINTNHIDEYVKLFDKKLKGFNNARIDGSLKLDSYELKLNAYVPDFSYDDKKFINTNFNGNGNRDTLYTDIAVDDIILNDSLHFPETKLKLVAHNDFSLIKLDTKAGNTLKEAQLNASIQTLSDGVRIHFYPSAFVINDKKWRLEKDGELTLRKNFIDANEVKFLSGEQEIVLFTELDDVTDDIYLVAKLKSVVIDDILPFWVTNPSLKGRLTGIARIRDPLGKQRISFEGVADSFSLEDKYIGKVNIAGKVNTITGLIDYKINTDEKEYIFDIDGSYNYKDSIGNAMNTRIITEKLNLNILEPFLGSVFNQINGTAKGDIVISGSGKNMTIIGDVLVDTGSIKVAFTQCRYIFSYETISFGKDVIDFGILKIQDTLKNTGSIGGKLYHKFFQDFRFENVRVETGKMLLLNTTKKDNSQFYGTVIGNALMTMNGPITNLKMNIDGQPSAIDSSHIYLNTDVSGKENSDIDYIDFIQFGSEMDKQILGNKATDIEVNMSITANPACKVDVILDEETGDIIKGQGMGTLKIKVGSTEPLSIRGRYEITKGEYTFNFQTWIKKKFTLSRGGSITWTGDPLLANIDIDADYLAERVDVSSITQSTNVKKKEDIIIISHLTGNLTKPVINFEFKLPENSDLNRDYFAVKKLADYKNNETEMFKQVASLLLVNAFITENDAFLSGVSTFNIAASTIGGVLSGFLTNVFNKQLERATKGILTTYIDIDPSVDPQSSVKEVQANIKAGLKILLNSRINVIIGGNLDYNNPYLQTTGLLTPDISLEWMLNKDGTLRIVGYNKTSIDLTSNYQNRTGIRLAYRKDVDKLSDLFKSKKKLRIQDSLRASR